MGSYSYICRSDNYDSIWNILFQNTEWLDEWGKSGMKFIILGTDLESVLKPNGHHVTTGSTPVLAIAAIFTGENYRFTEVGWNKFIGSLQPHSFDEGNHEVKFNSLNVKLNVYNLFYKTLTDWTIVSRSSEQLFWEYYKSGTMLTFSTCATMYGGGLQDGPNNNYPGPIVQESTESYRIKLNHSGRVYELYITD